MIQASGCIILSKDTKRVLFQLRAPDRKGKSFWGFWGGGSEGDEMPVETLKRELTEELGFYPDIDKIFPLHKMTSNDQRFEYNTFVVTVPNEFIPVINQESQGYAWVNYDRLPMPLHPGSKVVLQNPRLISKIKTIIDQIDN